MFNAEADILARLSAHPSIVTVYQAGISADGRPYIVMEYCPGSLARRYRIERLPVGEVLAIGVKMASALEAAHRLGLVHRDIKPSNILTTSFGVPVLADFGISSSLRRAGTDEVLAMSVPWSAPEVIAEKTAGTVASEVWSLGATVYSLLAGRSPFERPESGQNTREHLRRRIQRAAYPRMSRQDVPALLEDVLARAMDKEPSARFASAREFAVALQKVESDLGMPVTPIEAAVQEWAEPTGPDLADDSLRGAVRSVVQQPSTRKRAAPLPLRVLARDEDAEISTRSGRRRSALPWVLVGLAALVAVAAVAMAVLGGL